MLTSEVLRKAKEVVGTPDSWCRGCRGYTRTGRPGLGHEPGMVRRCALGAIDAAIGESCTDGQWAHFGTHKDQRSHPAVRALAIAVNNDGVAYWNNDPAVLHGDIMHGFARAIEYAEAREEAENAPAERVESPAMEEVK